MAEELSSLQKKEFTEAFGLFDKDGDNTISTKELGSVMRSLGLTPTDNELLEMVSEVDVNASGSIELPEFLKMMATHMSATDSDVEMETIFKIFDKKGQGYITAMELRHIMANLGEKLNDEELDEMIAAADSTNTGRVSFDDFVNMVTSK